MIPVDPSVIVFNYLCVLLLGIAIGYAIFSHRARSRSSAPRRPARKPLKTDEDLYLAALDLRLSCEDQLKEAREVEAKAEKAYRKTRGVS